MLGKVIGRVFLVVAMVFHVVVAQAVIIETVPVGDPGNAGEWSGWSYGGVGSDRICGAVSYTYNIGKYEVTAGQYTEFLNTVAKTDTYGLYNTSMGQQANRGCNIQRTGNTGSYTYSVPSDYANRPVNYVSYWDCCRFVNWLHNGQGNGDTETGAYTLNGYNSIDGESITRNPGAKWFLPSEDEWYKAAYYKGGSTNAGYWKYPTSSNTLPGRDLADGSGNNANYYSFGSSWPIDSPYYTTLAGEFQSSSSPYGTFDQGGNVWERAETIVDNDWETISVRVRRGGSFSGFSGYFSEEMAACSRPNETVTQEYDDIGFRVASVPEPGSLVMLVGLALTALLCWCRKQA